MKGQKIVDDLIKHIDRMMTIQVVITDRIPEQILESLEELLLVIPKERLLSAMEELLPAYINEHRKAMSMPAGSGIAAEFQMAAGLKHMYLEKAIDYLKAV